MENIISVILIDDQWITRNSVMNHIQENEPEMQIIAAEESAWELAQCGVADNTDAVFVNILRETSDTGRQIAHLREMISVKTPIITYSFLPDPAISAMQSAVVGATIHIRLNDSELDMTAFVRKLLQGEICSLLTKNKCSRCLCAVQTETILSPAERQVLKYTGLGKRGPQIAELLGISSKTVDEYRRRICIKLQLPNRKALYELATARANDM